MSVLFLKIKKSSVYRCISIWTFLSFLSLEARDCSVGKNLWLPRAFSSYGLHDLIAKKFLFNSDNNDTDQSFFFSFFTEYSQNFDQSCNSSHNLGALPFWSGTNILSIGTNNGKADFDAYQLGLGNVVLRSDGIAGKIQLNPKVQQIGCDMLLYYTHNREESGFFFQIHLPLGAMIIDANLKEIESVVPENISSFTQTTLNPNSSVITYQFPQYPPPFRRPATILDAFCGGDFGSRDQLAGNRSHPIRLRKGRIACEKQTIIALADVSLSFGYNFVIRKNGNFGIAAKVTCPTGNVPTADYMLEPIFGRAGLWGVGVEFTGFQNLWFNDTLTKYIDVWWQAEVLHLMPGRTPNWRSFDLKQNGKGSKYLLIQNYTADPSNGLFPYTIEPAVNITTLPVLSKIDIEALVACMIDCKYNDWNFGVGFEFWNRSAEDLRIDFRSAVDLRLPNLNNYVVLGRQVSSYVIDGQPNQLFTYYCEPLATIGQSQNPVRLVGSVPLVDEPAELPAGIKDARLSQNRIPEKLSDALDIAAAQALRVFSGKFFGQLGYTWVDHCYSPSLSLTGGIELSSDTNKNMKFWSVGLQWSLCI